MHSDETPHARIARFERIRRAKRWLRYLPRRARFHTYPVIGRFADFARARSYLWSFHYTQMRPSLYLGSVLTLLPVLGQVPIAFGLSLLFRTNFMILGGLQFLSNLLTLPLIIPVTLKLGLLVLNLTGLDQFSGLIPVDPTGVATEVGSGHKVVLWLSALTIGGLLCGLVLGAALDLIWRWSILPAARHRAAKKPITAVVTPHDPDSSTSTPPFTP